jgi:hypothetical protein
VCVKGGCKHKVRTPSVNEVSTWGVNAASEMPNKAIPKYDNPPLSFGDAHEGAGDGRGIESGGASLLSGDDSDGTEKRIGMR